ncbi:NAD(P)/FAD-dependent oxidoreductase [Bacillus sp. FJAT-42376]|uniref:NAD(P)/FAD-dependent oxidoreductase n=1 Tax=Bacillus sp. FJAT-42376 TaxID=2014076 RepID=UPI000F510892|nr:NAD(P)/FAD-dependent oxidoreductase [Bacillus sp. FJAT-42376]AZB41073.1 NAD(P)/FAD-dependent oxidoreductase [Bacillus sp. FJAT-42376]
MAVEDLFDVTIIGGGPAGLYSAFYSGLRGMKTKIVEFQPALGGKIQVYPEKMIWDVGGITPTAGAELMDQLIQQGLTFDPEIVLNEKIEAITQEPDRSYTLRGSSGSVHRSKTVIIAVGSGILKPKKLEIEGAEKFEVANIHYTIPSLMRFKDKTVVISGGGNSAIDWAHELEPFAKKVYITYRKENLSGHEAQVMQLLNSSVTCLPNTAIMKLVACEQHEKIKTVVLKNLETGETADLNVDDVIINHGYEQDTSLLKNSGLQIEMADDFYIAGNSTSETSVEGIYAAGDIISYEGKVNLIAGCFQDAANAVNKAKQYIEPTAQKFAMVSSHNEVFQKRNRQLVREMMIGKSN